MRRRITHIFVWLGLAVFMLVAASPVSSGERSGLKSPVITLENWKHSSPAERYSFLAGLVSYLELERYWQGDTALPIRNSTVGTWTRGLLGVTIKQMDDALNRYIAAEHPDAKGMTVLEALGRIYVRPRLTASERATAAARAEAARAVVRN